MRAYIMIGHVGSGKSSWSKMMAGMDISVIRVSGDDVRKMIKDRYAYVLQYEPVVDSFINSMVRDALSQGFSIVIDECHLTKAGRLKLCQLIKDTQPKTEIIYVYVKSDIKEGLDRRIAQSPIDDAEFVWHRVSERHQKLFEIPTKDENEFISEFMEVDNAKGNGS